MISFMEWHNCKKETELSFMSNVAFCSNLEAINFNAQTACNRKDTAKLLPVKRTITREREGNLGFILFIEIKDVRVYIRETAKGIA